MARKRRQGDPSDTSSEENFRSDKNETGPKCSHVKRAVEIQRLRKAFKRGPIENETCVECTKATNGDGEAEDFEYDRSLWMCLKCGSHLCGRTVNKHALKHYEVSQSIKLICIFFSLRRQITISLISRHLDPIAMRLL